MYVEATTMYVHLLQLTTVWETVVSCTSSSSSDGFGSSGFLVFIYIWEELLVIAYVYPIILYSSNISVSVCLSLLGNHFSAATGFF